MKVEMVKRMVDMWQCPVCKETYLYKGDAMMCKESHRVKDDERDESDL